MPLLPTDIDFIRPGFGYVAAEGADALFRLTIAPTARSPRSAPPGATNFIDLRTHGATGPIRLPIGIVISQRRRRSRSSPTTARATSRRSTSTPRPSPTSTTADVGPRASPLPDRRLGAASQLNGKRFFNTGLGRWSLNGAAWGSCGGVPHRRPHRQRDLVLRARPAPDDEPRRHLPSRPTRPISASSTGRRSTTRSPTSRATCAASPAASAPSSSRRAQHGPRADATRRPHQHSSTAQDARRSRGSRARAPTSADPNGASAHPHSVIGNWADITACVQTIRSPRAPTQPGRRPTSTAGQGALHAVGQGNCIGCHSGAQVDHLARSSTRPGDMPNDAVRRARPRHLAVDRSRGTRTLNGFPAALFPAHRSPAQRRTCARARRPTFEQIQCILRPVGTIMANGAGAHGRLTRGRQRARAPAGHGRPARRAPAASTPATSPRLQPAVAARPAGRRAVLPRRQRAHARGGAQRHLVQGHYQSAVAQDLQPDAGAGEAARGLPALHRRGRGAHRDPAKGYAAGRMFF